MKHLIALLLACALVFSLTACGRCVYTREDMKRARREAYNCGYADGEEEGYSGRTTDEYEKGFNAGYEEGYRDGKAAQD